MEDKDVTHVFISREIIYGNFDNKLSSNELIKICQFTNLTQLSLNNKHFVKSILHKIDIFTKLNQLDLCDNGLIQIPQAIFKLTNLTTLQLAKNKLITIPSEFNNFINLTILSLGSNRFKYVPCEIYKLITLEILHLGYNQLKFINQFIKLTRLELLYLNNNYLIISPLKKQSTVKIINNYKLIYYDDV